MNADGLDARDNDDEPQMKRATRLADLRIREVSGVDFPANDGLGGWLVAKSATDLPSYVTALAKSGRTIGSSIGSPHLAHNQSQEPTMKSDVFDLLSELPPDAQYQVIQAEADLRADERGSTREIEVTKMLQSPSGKHWYAEHGRDVGQAWSPRAATVQKSAAQQTRDDLFTVIKAAAVRAYPDLTSEQALSRYVGTPDGAELYERYRMA